MQDFTNLTIDKLAIHLVGNKSKEEDLLLSSELTPVSDETTHQYLKQFFFSSFLFDFSYHFFHDVDVDLNEIYTYTSNIFADPDTFLQQSVNIAKHLYEVSMHPNIKKGELYVSYISGCILDSTSVDAIGIFKSETKDHYLDIKSHKNGFNILCKQGINTHKLDKGCLIFSSSPNSEMKVYIVDSNANDALYWKDQFLKIAETSNEYSNTSSVLKTCKQFIKKAYDSEATEKISALNNSIQYFESHENFNVDEFASTVFTKPEHSDKFKTFLTETIPHHNYDESFLISTKAVNAVKKNIKNFIKLDSKIEIKINPQVYEVDDFVEKGYDERKKMNFYKIYYNNEE